MFVEIDSNYENFLMRSPQPTQTIDDFGKLFYAAADRKAFVKASLAFLKFVNQKWKDRYPPMVRLYLVDIIRRYPTVMGEVDGILPLILIVKEGNCECSLNGYCRCQIDELPDVLFSKLYCENISDAEYYILLFDKLHRNKHCLFFDPDSYDGSNINNLESANNLKRIFFAIADSDKKYSNDIDGSTAEAVKAEFSRTDNIFSTFYILKVREKENLVPVSILKDSNYFDSNKKKLLGIIANSPDEIKHYFDLKDGVTKELEDRILIDEDLKRVNLDVINEAKVQGIYIEDDECRIKGITSDGIDKSKNTVDYSRFWDEATVLQTTDLRSIFYQMLRFGLRYIPNLS